LKKLIASVLLIIIVNNNDVINPKTLKNQTQKSTFKSVAFVVFCLAVLIGCKKDIGTKEESNFDVENEVFRVITNSDVRYDVVILEIFPNTTTGDTTVNVHSRGSSDINYGFTPKKGSRVIVKASGVNAKTLNCTIGYKGKRLGADDLQANANSLYINFEYAIPK
jgi:hypothetical protein